ncbi:MAG TPA: response regulator transcription factor [Phenylobacterium sp.]|nr:response regulator transcription factor [Phenylobacterium sp.]
MARDDALKLLLVDDHPLFHAGLAAVLQANRPGYALLGAADAAAGLAVMEAEPMVDLVLVDIMLPGCDGFEAVALYGQRRPEVPRILISGREDPPTRLRASRSGASGYIAKSWPPGALLHVIDQVLAGGCCYEPPEGEAEPGAAPPLTDRQLEVLELLAQGRSNKEIGRRLDIADRTVRAHLTEIFLALGVTSRVQAVLHAQRLGLVPA